MIFGGLEPRVIQYNAGLCIKTIFHSQRLLINHEQIMKRLSTHLTHPFTPFSTRSQQPSSCICHPAFKQSRKNNSMISNLPSFYPAKTTTTTHHPPKKQEAPSNNHKNKNPLNLLIPFEEHRTSPTEKPPENRYGFLPPLSLDISSSSQI